MLAFMLALAAGAAEVPHEHYELPNGLEVILIPDSRLPQVVVDTWYDVGGFDDPEGRSGFAHLFEHLMFKGTERIAEGEFDSTMERAGGWNNASTSPSRTNYFDVGPSSALELLLWLEADRMTSLDITQAKLDTEREVVRNERRQSYEDRPYGKAWEALSGLLYSADNPLHRTVIGTHDDLMAASLDDVRSFYSTYYVPSNAVLTVAGDFDVASTKQLIATLFGQLDSPEVPERVVPAIPDALSSQVLTLDDRVTLPQTMMAWRTPAFFEPGDAECDILATVLAGSDDSRLVRRLVHQDKLAQSVSAWQGSGRWDSQLNILVRVPPGGDLERVEAIIDEELAALAGDRPLTADELERAANNLEMNLLHAAETLYSRAEMLQNYRMNAGQTDYFERDVERYRQATAAGVLGQAARLTPGTRITLRVVPEGGEQ